MKTYQTFDDVLEDPMEYRRRALSMNFRTYDFGHCVFHGIAVPPPPTLGLWLQEKRPDLTPTLTFFRQSPLDQVEPHFIHTDVDMGEWSAVLYLNAAPPSKDGTTLWTHKGTGTIESKIAHERSEEGQNEELWKPRVRIVGKFNRLLMFPSSYFHSRTIFENYGVGNDARLTQVMFGTGEL